jgi:hypothetical protein
MRGCEENAENDADPSHNNVGDAQERVLAADYGSGGDDNGFGTAVFGYVEVWSVLVGSLMQ